MNLRMPAAIAATALPLLAQNASFTTYGTGCNPGNAPPLIQALTMPQLGATFTVRYVALPAGQTPVSIDQPALLIGLQTALIPMPPISNIQPAGCNLLTSSEIAILMPWSGSSYANSYGMAIPNGAGLIGFAFHLQWAELYSRCQPTCVPMMVRVSNAGTATVGL